MMNPEKVSCAASSTRAPGGRDRLRGCLQGDIATVVRTSRPAPGRYTGVGSALRSRPRWDWPGAPARGTRLDHRHPGAAPAPGATARSPCTGRSSTGCGPGPDRETRDGPCRRRSSADRRSLDRRLSGPGVRERLKAQNGVLVENLWNVFQNRRLCKGSKSRTGRAWRSRAGGTASGR